MNKQSAACAQAEQEPGNWIVYSSGAEVESGLSLAEALEYLTPERAARQWCAVCVVDKPAEQEPVDIDPEWAPCVKLPVTVHVRQQRPGETHVSTREGITPVKPDDLIMRGAYGEEYPISREIFERTYRLGEAPKPIKQPLLADEICDSWEFIVGHHQIQFGRTSESHYIYLSLDEVIEFARAIERAHGIGEHE